MLDKSEHVFLFLVYIARLLFKKHSNLYSHQQDTKVLFSPILLVPEYYYSFSFYQSDEWKWYIIRLIFGFLTTSTFSYVYWLHWISFLWIAYSYPLLTFLLVCFFFLSICRHSLCVLEIHFFSHMCWDYFSEHVSSFFFFFYFI